MFEEYEESRIYPSDKRAMEEYRALLEREGIRRDGSLEYTLGLYDSQGSLVATGSYYKNTLRCLAVDSTHQGEGLMNRVVSRLTDLEAQRGVFHLSTPSATRSPCSGTSAFGRSAGSRGWWPSWKTAAAALTTTSSSFGRSSRKSPPGPARPPLS